MGSADPKIVWVLPSTRTWTRTASAAGTSRSAAATTARTMERRLNTNPPSARGSGCLRRAAGLLTRGSLSRRLPGLATSGVSARERLPSQRRDRPGVAPGSLTARLIGASLSWPCDDSLPSNRPLGAGRPLGGGDLRVFLDPLALERARG